MSIRLLCYLSFGFLILLSFGCEDDEMSMQTTGFGDGIYITNEGPFSNGVGSISYFDRIDNTVINNVFSDANAGMELGNIVQSMCIDNDKAYIVVNNSNKIEVANSTTFVSEGVIEGLNLPRYILPITASKAYVSQWGTNGVEGSVAIVDLSTNTITATIPTGKGAERMLLQNDKVYVACNGGFDRDSVISVIDTQSDAVINSIVVGDNPTSVVIDNQNRIFALARGYSDFNDPANNTVGQLTRIVDDVVVNTIDLSNGADDLIINASGDQLYFTMDGVLHTHSIFEDVFDSTPLINRYFYEIGFDPVSQNIVTADAGDFTSNGQIFRYDENGVVIDSFGVGVIPGSFYFE